MGERERERERGGEVRERVGEETGQVNRGPTVL